MVLVGYSSFLWAACEGFWTLVISLEAASMPEVAPPQA